jgi:hypothetical protein
MMPASPVKTEPGFGQLPVAALLENLNLSSSGLSSAEAALRPAHFGPKGTLRHRSVIDMDIERTSVLGTPV